MTVIHIEITTISERDYFPIILPKQITHFENVPENFVLIII